MRDNKRGGGGGGGHRRAKKARWFRPNDSGGTIPYGSRGVIVTCDGGKERAAVRDVVRNLMERAEQAFGYEAVGTASGDAGEGKESTGDVVADALRSELEGLREEKKKPALKEVSLDLARHLCQGVRRVGERMRHRRARQGGSRASEEHKRDVFEALHADDSRRGGLLRGCR